MRKLLFSVAAVALMAVPTVSMAQFTLGARVGYAMPTGDIGGDTGGTIALDDYASAAIPLQVDLGYKLTKNFTLGGYFSYAFGMLNSDLSDGCDLLGVDCSLSGMRFGVQGFWNFTPGASWDPWVGAGIGYESLTLDAGALGDETFSGWEYLNLQAGVDFQVGKSFALAPFLSYSFAQFSTYESDGDSADIPETSTHGWFQIGVRGNFSF